jgi:hypothetical protein
MRTFLYIFFFTAVILAGIGFFIHSENMSAGDLCIGLGVATLFFLWMPTFIYHRWKDKNVKDYMFSEDNIHKMRNYTKNNNL